MKSRALCMRRVQKMSRPTRGAWIEIESEDEYFKIAKSRPTRGAWIEICTRRAYRSTTRRSRPTRGAWIEIVYVCYNCLHDHVAPHAGRVD